MYFLLLFVCCIEAKRNNKWPLGQLDLQHLLLIKLEVSIILGSSLCKDVGCKFLENKFGFWSEGKKEECGVVTKW